MNVRGKFSSSDTKNVQVTRSSSEKTRDSSGKSNVQGGGASASCQMDTTQPTKKGLEKLTRAKMAQRRGKRLCFNCDDLYTPDHVCKHVLFYIQQIPDSEHKEDEIIEKEWKSP